MANIFKRYFSSNIGTSSTTVGNYVVDPNTGAVVIGLTVSNTTNTEVSANVTLYNGVNDYYLVKNAPIPMGGALVLVGGEQKLILQANDRVRISSTSSNSIDAILTLMESTEVGVTADPVTYSISSNISSVNEGNTVSYTVSTSNVLDGTLLYWSADGNVAAADFTDNTNTGIVTITNGTGTITRTLTSDTATEGTEYIQMKLYTDAAYTTLVATSANVTVNDTSTAAPSGPPSLSASASAVPIGTTSSGAIQTPSLSKLNSSQVILVHEDGLSAIRSNIFTVSGSGISYDSDQSIYSGTGGSYKSTMYLSDNKVLTTFTEAYGSVIRAGVINVSANVATLGTLSNIAPTSGAYMSAVALSSTSAICIYRDSSTSNIAAVAMSISSDIVTAGTPVTLSSGGGGTVIYIAKMSSTKAIAGYRDGSNFYTQVLTVSGTTITAGTQLLMSYNGAVGAVSDSAAIIIYNTTSTSVNGGSIMAQRLSISGSTISLSGSAVTIAANADASLPLINITNIDSTNYLFGYGQWVDPFPSLTTRRTRAVAIQDNGSSLSVGSDTIVGPDSNTGPQNLTVAVLPNNLAVVAWQASNVDSMYYCAPVSIT